MVTFSKCGTVSSDCMLTCQSKHTLFLHSRCQSYFLVSSHNGPVKLCQACFLCTRPLALNFMQHFLESEYSLAMATEPQAKWELSVLSVVSLSSWCSPLAWNKVRLKLSFTFVSSGPAGVGQGSVHLKWFWLTCSWCSWDSGPGLEPHSTLSVFPPSLLNLITCNFNALHPEPHTKLYNMVSLDGLADLWL